MRQIELKGKPYPFKLSYNQQRAWQERFGKSFDNLGDELPFEECIALVHHGLKAGSFISGQELDVSEDDLGELLDQAEIIKYVQYLILDISKSVEEVSGNVKKKVVTKA